MQKTKAKHKVRSYPLRRVLLVMVLGWSFTFWMPFVIIIGNGLHWTNYVIFWGAAWAWLIPFVRWMKHNRHRSVHYRMSVFGLLLLLWCLCLGFGTFIGHGLPVTHVYYSDTCSVARHRHYECYFAQIEWSRYGNSDSLLERHTTQIIAERIGDLPIARVTGFKPHYVFCQGMLCR